MISTQAQRDRWRRYRLANRERILERQRLKRKGMAVPKESRKFKPSHYDKLTRINSAKRAAVSQRRMSSEIGKRQQLRREIEEIRWTA